MTSVIIPRSVTYIGEFAFRGCTGLTSIMIPKSVTCIDYGAFALCKGLVDIYCEAESKPEEWDDEWGFEMYTSHGYDLERDEEVNVSVRIHWGSRD